MNLSHQRVKEAERLLGDLLGPELTEIVQAVTQDPNSEGSYFIQIPTADHVDFTIEDLGSLVSKTSNTYARVARLAGMARAELKLADGRYKRKYKMNRVGSNESAREKNATEASIDEWTALNTIEAVVELAEALEAHCRMASESARKLYDKVRTMEIASKREEHGHLKDSEYRY